MTLLTFLFSLNCSEQCYTLVSGIYKTSCKTGEGVEEMFSDIAQQLIDSNRSKMDLDLLSEAGFKVTYKEEKQNGACLC